MRGAAAAPLAFCTAPQQRDGAVTARRSDGPTEPARNMGLRAFLLFAACVTMPPYTGPAVRQDRWALFIGNPKDAGSCKRLPVQGGTIPRHAQAPPHAPPTHGAEPSLFSRFGACLHSPCVHGASFLAVSFRAQRPGLSVSPPHPLLRRRFSPPLSALPCPAVPPARPSSRKHGGRLSRGRAAGNSGRGRR